jgi:hypothetical protein
MNTILFTGAHGNGTEGGLLLIFLLIFITGNFYYSWKRKKKISKESGSEGIDIKYWKPRIISSIAILIGLFLPVIRTLIAENRIGVIKGNYKGSVFDAYSGQVFLNLILFFLFPFLVSVIAMIIKKEFPTRVFNNLVIIFVVFVSFMFILHSFNHR